MATLRELAAKGITKVRSAKWDPTDYLRLRKDDKGNVWGEVYVSEGALMSGPVPMRIPFDKIADMQFWEPFKEED